MNIKKGISIEKARPITYTWAAPTVHKIRLRVKGAIISLSLGRSSYNDSIDLPIISLNLFGSKGLRSMLKIPCPLSFFIKTINPDPINIKHNRSTVNKPGISSTKKNDPATAKMRPEIRSKFPSINTFVTHFPKDALLLFFK